jgi:hypothetical protein
MRGRFALSKYLPWIVFVTIVVDSAFSSANQIAQGFVEIKITATSSPQTITSATCGVTLSAFDSKIPELSYTENVSKEVTPVNNVVTCTVTAPYDWSFTDLTGNISIGYSVGGQNGSAIQKSTSGGFAPIPLTTTGTTVFTVSTVF